MMIRRRMRPRTRFAYAVRRRNFFSQQQRDDYIFKSRFSIREIHMIL